MSDYIDDLRSELANDPLARGYAGMTDAEVVADINSQYRSRNRDSMSGAEIGAAIDSAEYTALADEAHKDRLIALSNLDSVDPFGFAQTIILDIFAGGSNTVQALAAARVESISRAEELFQRDVKEGHVGEARS